MLNTAEKYQRKYLEAFTDAFRFHKRKSGLTSLQLATQLGVEKSSVDKWSLAENAPHGGNLLALLHVFGPEFLNDILVRFGFGGVTEIDSPEINPFRVLSEINNSSAVLSDALSDQRIDHTEKPRLIRAISAGIDALNRLQADLLK